MNIQALENSFAYIKPHATEFVNNFYNNLFHDYPQVKPLFANTNMTEQKKHLMDALILVINNLKQPEVLAETLKHLGSRHVKYGTLQEHYSMVGQSLLKTLKSSLGSEWTPEVEKSWIDAYGVITNVMLAGAKDYAKS